MTIPWSYSNGVITVERSTAKTCSTSIRFWKEIGNAVITAECVGCPNNFDVIQTRDTEPELYKEEGATLKIASNHVGTCSFISGTSSIQINLKFHIDGNDYVPTGIRVDLNQTIGPASVGRDILYLVATYQEVDAGGNVVHHHTAHILIIMEQSGGGG